MRFFLDLLRYGAASAVALVVDAGTLLLLVSFFGVNYFVAASLGFLSGLAVVYALSVRYVYDDARVLLPSQEAAGFLVTGLIGLMLTQASMALLVGACGLSVGVAKIPTLTLVFLFNFLSRRMLLFQSCETPSSGAVMAGLVPAIHATQPLQMRGGWSYFMTNRPNGMLYTGATSNLARRLRGRSRRGWPGQARP